MRILGRNLIRTKDGHLDEAWDLEGEPSDLSNVVPISLSVPKSSLSYSNKIVMKKKEREKKSAPLRQVVRSGMKQRAQALRTEPYSGGGGNIIADMSLLAKAAIRESGKDADGRKLFDEWCQELEARVPADKTRTLAQLRTRADYVWTGACGYMVSGAGMGFGGNRGDLLGTWQPLTPANLTKNGFEHFKRPKKAAWRAYKAVADYIILHRFDPHCFSIAYKHWATLANYKGDDKTPCREAVNAAEEAGLLFRLDRGAVGVRDLCTLVTFVGIGETPQIAYDLGTGSEAYRERLQVRSDRGLPPPSSYIRNGRLFFTSSKKHTTTTEPQTSAADEAA